MSVFYFVRERKIKILLGGLLMSEAKFSYLGRESDGTLQIKTLEITSYEIPQLNRIEKKLDSILEKLNNQELSKRDY